MKFENQSGVDHTKVPVEHYQYQANDEAKKNPGIDAQELKTRVMDAIESDVMSYVDFDEAIVKALDHSEEGS